MKKCLFCGRSAPEAKMTGEHVLRRELINQVLWEAPQSRTETVHHGYSDGTQIAMSRQVPQSILNQTLKDVCGGCNNGWMNNLEILAEKKLVPFSAVNTLTSAKPTPRFSRRGRPRQPWSGHAWTATTPTPSPKTTAPTS
ncbi:hypothetical protein ACFV2B_11435 [Streptomyces lavendulae]|uniref:hypothetical protein n=1 Tax=Streptomyces lavendulae TaxID=1914 RepID=UPI00368EFA32